MSHSNLVASQFLKKTEESPYQPILNDLFLFLTLTNTLTYPVGVVELNVILRNNLFQVLCIQVHGDASFSGQVRIVLSNKRIRIDMCV